MRVDYGHLFIYLYQYADGITRIKTRAGMPKLFLEQPKKFDSLKKVYKSRSFSLIPKYNKTHSVFRGGDNFVQKWFSAV